jgi:MATE family multidrug resistance protein
MKKLLWYGLPQGFESFMSLAAFSAMILLLHSEGEIAATASTIMFNWDYVSFLPLTGIQVAVTSLVGKYMGAKDVKSATKVAFSGIKTALVYSGIIFLLYTFCTEALVNLFRPDQASETFTQAFPMAKTMLRLATIYIFADAITFCFVGTLRGAGDTHWTMLAFIIMHWLAVFILFISLKVFDSSAVTGWGVLVFTFLSFSFILFWRFKQGKWKTLDIINE